MRRRVEAGAKQDDWQHRDECPSHRRNGQEEAVHAGWVVQPAAHPRGKAQGWAAEDRGEEDEGRPHAARLALIHDPPANQSSQPRYAQMKLSVSFSSCHPLYSHLPPSADTTLRPNDSSHSPWCCAAAGC